MTYDNSTIRRQDRLLDQERADELLRTSEFGTLSMADNDGTPYGIPINFVWDGAESVYLHCAPEGRKLRVLAKNPQVSFSIVGRVHLLRMKALKLLLAKLSPDDMEVGLRYAEKSFGRTAIIRLDITHYSGKSKVVRTF